MKLKFRESEISADVTLEPESIEEMTKLLRFANNAKKEPARVYINFSDGEPHLNIYIKKRHRSKQSNSISNTRKGGQTT